MKIYKYREQVQAVIILAAMAIAIVSFIITLSNALNIKDIDRKLINAEFFPDHTHSLDEIMLQSIPFEEYDVMIRDSIIPTDHLPALENIKQNQKIINSMRVLNELFDSILDSRVRVSDYESVLDIRPSADNDR